MVSWQVRDKMERQGAQVKKLEANHAHLISRNNFKVLIFQVSQRPEVRMLLPSEVFCSRKGQTRSHIPGSWSFSCSESVRFSAGDLIWWGMAVGTELERPWRADGAILFPT